MFVAPYPQGSVELRRSDITHPRTAKIPWMQIRGFYRRCVYVAPVELLSIVVVTPFYKHFAPTELGRGWSKFGE